MENVFAKYGDYSNLLLRIGLGLFMLVFGLSKFTMASFWSGTYPKFYSFAVSSALMSSVGIVQIVVGIMLIIGLKTVLAALIATLMHLSTVLVTLKKRVAPFGLPEGSPPSFLFFAAVPVLFAYLALLVMGAGKYGMDNQ